MDSRQYIVAFELRSTGDCPPDFELPSVLAAFDAGLFLPRDDPDWFGRSSYPPRVLLLKGRTLYIVSHPSTGEPPRRCAIERISAVESGHMLLKGWLRFAGSGFDYTVPYNTRGFPSASRFMRRFRDKLLPGAQPAAVLEAGTGTGLDIKFGNALTRELDPGEAILAQVFQPARKVRSRTLSIPHRHWIAGDLLAVTGRRLLWITDRVMGSYSPYGSIASYAPLDAFESAGVTSGQRGHILQVDLNDGSGWRIPIAADSSPDCRRAAEDFAVSLEIQKRCNEANKTEARQ
ncbi:MAG: hypothetical protein ACLQVN_10280 [Bryobacteraceae bacterium]